MSYVCNMMTNYTDLTSPQQGWRMAMAWSKYTYFSLLFGHDNNLDKYNINNF